MDEQFHNSTGLNKDALRELMSRRSDGPALRRFSFQYGLLLGASLLVVISPTLALPSWVMFAGMFVFALMTMSMFAIVHESGHNTAFASRRLNRTVLWLAGAPVYYAPTGFREFHFAHHRHTHDPLRDPEISIGGRPGPSLGSGLPMYLAFVSGLPLMLFKIVMLMAAAVGVKPVWEHFLTFVSPRAQRRMSWEARAVLALHALWLTAGLLWLPGLLWLLAAQVLGHFMLSTYLISEHTGLAHSGDILERTRTTLTQPVLRWLMWNMPYHGEHHAYPAVPWHALPDLHKLMQSELLHVEPGYHSFHRKALGSLLRGKVFQEVP